MFALTQGLRRAAQTKPNGISTHFASRRRTWQQTIDRVSRIAGALFWACDLATAWPSWP